MLAITVDGYALAAIIVVALVVLALGVLLIRVVRSDHKIRVARMGVFIERERVDEIEPKQPRRDRWSPEPVPDKDEELTKEWPARKEEEQ